MSKNPGKESRAGIIKRIIAHFHGKVPPLVRAINPEYFALRMTIEDIALANIGVETPGLAVIEMVDLKTAQVAVRGLDGQRTLLTWFQLSSGGEVQASCPCQNKNRLPCAHILTAAIVLSEIAAAAAPDPEGIPDPTDWRAGITRLVGSRVLARPRTASAREPVELFFVMSEIFNGFEVHPLIISGSEIPAEARQNNETLGRYLLGRADDREFNQKVREVKVSDIPKLSLLNSTPLSATLIKSALDQLQLNQTSYTPSRVYFWEGLADQLVFLGRHSTPFGERLKVVGDLVPVEMKIVHHEAGLQLSPVALHPDGPVDLTSPGISLFFGQPLWLRLKSTIFRVNLTTESLNLLRGMGRVSVPADGVEEFYEYHLPEIVGHLPFNVNAANFIDLLDTSPVPRIYLMEKDQELRVRLRFGYAEHELGAMRKVPPHSFSYDREQGRGIRIARQAESELRWYSLLEDGSTGLKSGSRRDKGSPDTFLLRKGVHPFDFLTRHLPRLVEAGFEVYGESALTSRVNRAKPTISFNVTSGIDWFDLKATITWGDQQVPLENLRRALRRDERFIKLADGSIGEIPSDWLDKYRHLFGLSEARDDGYRVSRHHVALLDDLFASSEKVRVDRKFEAAREWLRNFDGITAHDAPTRFCGELRPYQKAGFDWLHFLRQAGFGGCLADDMGTGKTIQTLSFLLSLKEENEQLNRRRRKKEPAPVHLLVVPRSLVVNWIREAERFTPDLRILDFAHGLRTSDLLEFNKHDIVITTYGILIREIDRLRDYEFDTAILDEAQAIKNPASESARAARAINCRHRLTLTGTPVENNTFELWSQFAFLNPGLLGSADYFREHFIGPIERQNDEPTARTLKRLIHPFILRRTKDQVVSDLPPRSEKILWGEMEPDQRQVYDETRNHYRDLLAKLIEEKGIRQARFRILEGLLRLRQICNHPKLVSSGYRGGSAKMDALLETLETARAEGHKILVFSQFVKMLKLIETELVRRQTPFAYLDGSTTNRQERVDQFQQDDGVGIFLISLKAGGVGLNLTAADYVVHVDPWWNPAVEMQASDRAHRIGQDKPVFIYKLMIKDSVEEKILQLQEKKRSLVTQLISTEAGFFKSLNSEDIELLFT